MSDTSEPDDPTRRSFVGKAAYVAPVILSLQAASAYAKSGSAKDSDPTDRPVRPPRPWPRWPWWPW